MWKSLRSIALVATIALGAIACGHPRDPHQAAADLSSPSTDVRLKAARDIEDAARKPAGLPPDIVETLLQHQASEPDFKTRASELITLGYTGDPRVKPILDQYAQTDDKQQRIYAARALKKWASKTGAVPANYEFPETWPYGTPGYPPPLPK